MKYRIKTLDEFKAEHKHDAQKGFDCGLLNFMPDMFHLEGCLLTDLEVRKLMRNKRPRLSLTNGPAKCDNTWYFTRDMMTPVVKSTDLQNMLRGIVAWKNQLPEVPAEFKNLLFNAEKLLRDAD